MSEPTQKPPRRLGWPDALFAMGLACIAFGAGMIRPAAGVIVAGAGMIVFGFLAARAE